MSHAIGCEEEVQEVAWIVLVCKNPRLGVLVGAHLWRGITPSLHEICWEGDANAKKSE